VDLNSKDISHYELSMNYGLVSDKKIFKLL